VSIYWEEVVATCSDTKGTKLQQSQRGDPGTLSWLESLPPSVVSFEHHDQVTNPPSDCLEVWDLTGEGSVEPTALESWSQLAHESACRGEEDQRITS
jgi:hypothetical protein